MSSPATAPRRSKATLQTRLLNPATIGQTVLAYPAALPAILLLGLAIRLALIPVESFQADAARRELWTQRLLSEPLPDFYASDIGFGIFPGELWLLWLAAHFYEALSPLFQALAIPLPALLELIPVFADVGIGVVLFLLGRGFAGSAAGLVAAALYLFNPGPIFITSVWGQWDAVGLVFVLLGLWLFLRGSPIVAAMALVYAVLIGPRFALLLPLFAIAFILQHWRPASWRFAFGGPSATLPADHGRMWLRGLGALTAGGAVALFALLPFGVGLPPLPARWSLWDLLAKSGDVYPFTSVNAFNLWATPLAGIGWPDDQTNLFAFSDRLWGQGLLAVACLAVLVNLWRHGGDRALVWACFATNLAVFVLPTRVQERHLLPAVAFAALAAAIAPGASWVYVALSLILVGNVAAVYRLGHANPDLTLLPSFSPWVAATSLLCVGIFVYLLLRGREVIVKDLTVSLASEAQASLEQASASAHGVLNRLRDREAQFWGDLVLIVPIVAVGLALTLGIRLGDVPHVDNDYWWHLAAGEWILDNRAIPTTDPFSWTHGGQEWIPHEWFAEVIQAATVRATGYVGAIVLTGVVAIAGFWRLMAGVRAYGLSRRAICLLMLLWGGVFIRGNVMTVRPQLWSLALFAVLLAAIAEHETGRRRTLWLLPPLFVLWINVNLSALIGIACLGAFTLDRFLHHRLDRHLFTASALSVVALLVNPSGLGLADAVLRYGNPAASRHLNILEWMQPVLGEPTHLGFVFALPMAALAIPQLLRGRLWPTLPLLALAYQSFTALRFVPLYVMVAFIFAGWLVWKRELDVAPLAKWTPLIPLSARTTALAANVAAVVIVIAATASPSQFQREPLEVGFPEEAATMILEEYPGARIFNVYDYGGYLIHRFDGENQVFVDGREEMYGEPFMRQYWSFIYGESGWEDYFDSNGIEVAVVRPWDGLYYQLTESPNWVQVQGDGFAAMFVRAA
jgi:hypothetical protein